MQGCMNSNKSPWSNPTFTNQPLTGRAETEEQKGGWQRSRSTRDRAGLAVRDSSTPAEMFHTAAVGRAPKGDSAIKPDGMKGTGKLKGA